MNKSCYLGDMISPGMVVLKKTLWQELCMVGRNVRNFCLYILRCSHCTQKFLTFQACVRSVVPYDLGSEIRGLHRTTQSWREMTWWWTSNVKSWYHLGLVSLGHVQRMDVGSWVKKYREIVVKDIRGEVDHEQLGMNLYRAILEWINIQHDMTQDRVKWKYTSMENRRQRQRRNKCVDDMLQRHFGQESPE